MAMVAAWSSGAVIAQAPPAVPVAGQDEPEQEAPRETSVKFQGSSGVGGFGAMTPRTWGVIQTHLRNPLESEQEVRIMFRFTDTPNRQFLRNAKLPPRSTRTAEMPARPGDVDAEAKSIDTEIILFPPAGEVEMDRAAGSAIVKQEPYTFAVISDTDLTEEQTRIDDEAIDALTAVRLQNGLSATRAERQGEDEKEAEADEPAAAPAAGGEPQRQVLSASILYPTGETTPRFDIAWDPIYLTAITQDRLALDSAQRRALRRWVARGGVLVVWADQVDIGGMSAVLGETWDIAEVDKVTLTEVKIDTAPPLPAIEAVMRTEKPITMTRVIAPIGWERHMMVRGWPAVVSKPLGRGRVVAIMLGGRAWTATTIKAAGAKPAKPGTEQALEQLTNLLLPPAEAQASVSRNPADVLVAEAGQAYVTQLIGYGIVSRQTVGAVLALFLALFALGGLYWHKQGHGERLGLATIGLSVLAAAVLVGLGMSQRRDLEPTAAALQLVEVQPGLSSVHVSGVTALYEPNNTDASVQGELGGWLWPLEVSSAEKIQRLRTVDLDKWQWSGLTIKAGSPEPLTFAMDVEAPRAFDADLSYTEQGLTGTIQWPATTPFEDLLLTTPKANLAPRVEPEGDAVRVTIGPEQVLPEGTFYLSELTLSGLQQDRAAMLKTMMKMSRFDRPTLLGWSEGFEQTYRIEPDLKRIDKALWAAPMHVKASPVGQRVTVPWPLVPMEQIRYDDSAARFGFATMPLYQSGGRFEDTNKDNRPDEFTYWIPTPMASGFIGKFYIPPQVRPLKIESARIHLNMEAVGRPVRLLAIRDGKAVELKTLQGPDGVNIVEVPGDQLQIEPDGGVQIAFDVQDPGGTGAGANIPRSSSMTAMWRVRYFGLEVDGVVEPRK